jgi:hypothetical protein
MRLVRCALAVLLFLATQSVTEAATPIGQVMAIKGSLFREAGDKREALAAGAPVFVTDTVVAEGGGKAKILLNDGSILSIGENARVTIAQYQGADNHLTTRLNAGAGPIRLFVNRLLPDRHFEVESETAIAAVRGTDWVIEVMPQQTSMVLLEGVVAVRGKGAAGGAEVLLQKRGDGTDVRRGEAPAVVHPWGAERLATTVARASFD